MPQAADRRAPQDRRHRHRRPPFPPQRDRPVWRRRDRRKLGPDPRGHRPDRKPAPGSEPSDLAILGRYVLAPAIFEELDRIKPGTGKEIQLTDAIKAAVGRHPVVAYEFEGDYYDTGTVPGYLRANLMLAMKREGLREELEPLLRELLDESSAKPARRAF